MILERDSPHQPAIKISDPTRFHFGWSLSGCAFQTPSPRLHPSVAHVHTCLYFRYMRFHTMYGLRQVVDVQKRVQEHMPESYLCALPMVWSSLTSSRGYDPWLVFQSLVRLAFLASGAQRRRQHGQAGKLREEVQVPAQFPPSSKPPSLEMQARANRHDDLSRLSGRVWWLVDTYTIKQISESVRCAVD